LPRYVALGRSPRDSRSVLRRYKGSGELRDIFVMDRLRMGSGGLYYFYEAVGDWLPIAFYLVSFDIGGYEPKVYSRVKARMMFNACAHVDLSTYICPEEVEIPEAGRVEAFWVRPLGEAREYLKERFMDTFKQLSERLAEMTGKVAGADRRANRLRRAAEKLLATAPAVARMLRKHKEKFETIDVNAEDIAESIESSAEELRKALARKWGQPKSI